MITDACVQGSAKPCKCACPYNFDVEAFIRKVKSRNWNSAYRELVNTMCFPSVAVELCGEGCRDVCPQRINMPLLERSCIANAKRKEPPRFSVQPREGRAAVIGSGPAGMAAVFRLASRRYQVTLFEKNDGIGGSLREVMDESVYMAEYALQFTHVSYELAAGREIKSLNELSDFDVIIVASGKGGEDFGLLGSFAMNSMTTDRRGVFLAGEVTGASKAEAIYHGMLAGASAEKFMNAGLLTGVAEMFPVDSCALPCIKGDGTSAVLPAGELYTNDEAAEEANRCLLCDCSSCYTSCEFMKHFREKPISLENKMLISRGVAKDLIERTGSREIFSCNVCGHCGSKCSKGVSMEGVMLEAKQALFESGGFYPVLHEFFMRDMEDALGENYLAASPDTSAPSKYLLYPGCQITQSGREYILGSYRYLLGLDANSAIVLGCCGAPALYAGNAKLFDEVFSRIEKEWRSFGEPIIVTICPACRKIITKYLPEAKCTSIYELMAEHGMPHAKNAEHEEWAVFDPCAAREFPAMQEAVRKLAGKCRNKLSELSDSREQAICCGMGGHVYPAARSLTKKNVEKAVGQSPLPYLTYCANCRNIFLSAGKRAKHILDDVFNVAPAERPYHIAELRRARSETKERVQSCFFGIHQSESGLNEDAPMNIRADDEMLGRLDRELIGIDEVRRIIERCEAERTYAAEDDLHICHGKVGSVTFWLKYAVIEAGYELKDVYSHRLSIMA